MGLSSLPALDDDGDTKMDMVVHVISSEIVKSAVIFTTPCILLHVFLQLTVFCYCYTAVLL